MSQYLTYQQYASNGGTAELSAFPLLERRARAKLDYWTQGRIRCVDSDIQLCMVLIINALDSVQDSGQEVTSFNNDGVSVSLSSPNRKTEEEVMSSVYDQVVEILPVELVSVAINYEISKHQNTHMGPHCHRPKQTGWPGQS